jgi:hypothetical protein
MRPKAASRVVLILVGGIPSATEKWLIVSFSSCQLRVCVFVPESFAAERVLTQHANEANALLNSLSANICSGHKRERAGNSPHTPSCKRKGFQPLSSMEEFMGACSCVPRNYRTFVKKFH